MRSDISSRLKKLERSHHADQVIDEATQMRLFLGKLTDEELERLTGIVQRKEAGIDPTAEEQAFIDNLEARYAPD